MSSPAIDQQEWTARILLTLCLEHRSGMLRSLLQKKGSAYAVLAMSDEALAPHLDPLYIQRIRDPKFLMQAHHEYERVIKQGIDLLFPQNDNYPSLLGHCHDHPILLYKKGNADLNVTRVVSIVGTRKPTPYGMRLVEKIIEELSPYRPLIVSGLAYGVDVAAHQLALEKGMQTVAILGSGLASIYPSDHDSIAQKMTTQGGIVSEYPLHAKPRLHHFPLRNRIIAGLSHGTIVVESKVKGGAMITAYLTLDYNRELMTFPHSIFSESGTGCTHLCKQTMAHLIESGKDVAQILGWTLEEKNDKEDAQQSAMALLSEAEARLFSLIKAQDSIHIDYLRTQFNGEDAAFPSHLLHLEMNGLIKRLPGNFYQKR